MEEVFVIDAVRTPIGRLGGSLKTVPATDLGAVAIGALYKNLSLDPDHIEEVIMGNALPAGLGQGPGRQAALRAGLKNTTSSCTINKAGASGMRAVMFASQQIRTGDSRVLVAGGMESMSNVPHYSTEARYGTLLGHTRLQDGIIRDGLWEVFKNRYLGNEVEHCARTHRITRQQQDAFAIESHRRAAQAHDQRAFESEIATVKVRSRKGQVDVISRDEETVRFDPDRVRKLQPLYEKDGTVTSANASTLGDGAAALLLADGHRAGKLGLQPVARLVSQANAAQAPEWFTTSPAKAVNLALERAGKKISDMDLIEINENFAVVGLINTELLDINPSIVNVHGGAIGLGHPLGTSGARILVTLIHALRRYNKKWGCAAVCNGGGGASAIVVECLA